MDENFRFDYDVALSYAFSLGDEEEQALTERVVASLSEAGIRVYLIREDDAPKTRRWARRYYESLFRSRYFVPILSRRYLMGAGARLELDAISELVGLRRSFGFFYPLVPIVSNIDYLKREAMLDVAGATSIDAGKFEWLRTHSFPILLDWGTEAVGAFFRSLVRGARGESNLDWLRVVSSQIRALRFEERFGRPSVLLQLENALFQHDFEFLVGARGVRFAGCLFEPEDALTKFERTKIVDRLEEHVRSADEGLPVARCSGCRFRRVWRAGLDDVCPLCRGVIEKVAAGLREPQRHEFFLCESCGHVGIPATYEVGAECPKCGGQMSDRAGESVQRLFLKKFGKEA